MKRLFIIFSVCMLLFSCSSDAPQKCVEECWHNIERGRYKRAVECFDITPDEEPVFREMFAEQGAKVKEAEGVESVEIRSYDIASDSATVEAAVTFGNGQTVTQNYRLVLKEGKWLITW